MFDPLSTSGFFPIPQGGDPEEAFVFREHERARLFNLLLYPPTRTQVLAGPRAAGKTWLLEHLLVRHPELVGRPGLPALFVDGCTQQLASTADLIAAFRHSALIWAKSVNRTSSPFFRRIETFPHEVTEFEFGPFTFTVDSNRYQGHPLTRMLNLVVDLMNDPSFATGKGSDVPVIIIDEAHTMTRGPAVNDSELRALLQFFVVVRSPTLSRRRQLFFFVTIFFSPRVGQAIAAPHRPRVQGLTSRRTGDPRLTTHLNSRPSFSDDQGEPGEAGGARHLLHVPKQLPLSAPA